MIVRERFERESVGYRARMRQVDRLATVLDELSADGSVSVSELSERFGVSVATIRRDLQLLEEQRLVSRVHGGAVARGILYELPLRYKVARHQEEKRRIAAAAAALVEEGTTVGLTGGTTTTEVARTLGDTPGLTVVTNALNIASELAVRSHLKLVVPGGRRPRLLLRARRPDRRGRARGAQPRPGLRRRRRDLDARPAAPPTTRSRRTRTGP